MEEEMIDLTKMKKGICTLKLEGLKKVFNDAGEVDPTLIKATFSIIDFSVSGNKQQISKEVALNSAYSLKNKPLLCQYRETTDYEEPNDDFGTHGEYEGKLRDGTDYIMTDSHAIGVCPEKGYLGVTKEENNNDIDVLMADFVLWKYRYPNEIMLINQFYENKEPLYSSCEYFYTSSKVENGIEFIEKLYFDGHTVLGRDIEPAYQSSKLISFNTKWSKAINELSKTSNQNNTNDNESNNNSDSIINKNNNSQKEESLMENIFLKAMNNLSFGDIRDKIYVELSKIMTADIFEYVWISIYDVHDTYFILETRIDNEWVHFKVPYTVNENDELSVDYEGKVKAEFKADWVAVSEMTTVQNSLNTKKSELETANQAITDLQGQLNAKDETIKSLNSTVETTTEEKNVTIEKFNDLAETVTALNSQVKVLQPLADRYNQEQYEKQLNSAKDYYKEKFENIDSLDVFEKEDTQELIIKSINSSADESQKAKFALNDLIINNLKPIENRPQISLNSVQLAKDTKNLTEVVDEFEERYGFKRD